MLVSPHRAADWCSQLVDDCQVAKKALQRPRDARSWQTRSNGRLGAKAATGRVRGDFRPLDAEEGAAGRLSTRYLMPVASRCWIPIQPTTFAKLVLDSIQQMHPTDVT